MNSQERLEDNLRKLRELVQFQSRTANNISARRSLAKGKVRLNWNHKISTNVTQYRIDKIAAQSLVIKEEAPSPVQLTQAELRHKHYRMT